MQKQKRQQRQAPREKSVIPHPPPLQTQLHMNTTLRFVTVAALTNSTITFQNLLDAMFIATSATTGVTLFDAVRVRRVSLWARTIESTGVTTVNLTFAGPSAGYSGDAKTISDTSMSIEPAHVSARPDPESGAAMWQATGNVTAFIITAPALAVVDVQLSYRTIQTNGVAATQNVPVGATAGELYYRGLDGLAIASTQYTPQGGVLTR